MHTEIIEDIGEKELINRLGKFMPKNQISDDCALIKTKNENLLAVSYTHLTLPTNKAV